MPESCGAAAAVPGGSRRARGQVCEAGQAARRPPLHNLSNLCLELARRDQEKDDEAVRADPSSVGAKRSGDRSTKHHNKKRKAA